MCHTGGRLPAAVGYAGGAYHTSCAVHALTKASACSDRSAALRALADLAAAAPPDTGDGSAAASLPAPLERVLSCGDPGLRASLPDSVSDPYVGDDAAGALWMTSA